MNGNFENELKFSDYAYVVFKPILAMLITTKAAISNPIKSLKTE